MLAALLFQTSFLLTCSAAPLGQDIPRFSSPAWHRAEAERSRLQQEAWALVQDNKLDRALPLYKRAAAIEESMSGVGGAATGAWGDALREAGRLQEACEVYSRLVRWDYEKDEPYCVLMSASLWMEYAIALSDLGRAKEAVAVYHYGLSAFGSSHRGSVPIPFTVVFEPDPEGIYWTYTKDDFKAAALMVTLMSNSKGRTDELIKVICDLAPNWYYPYAFLAVQNSAKTEEMLRIAKRKVTPKEEALFQPFMEFCLARLAIIRAEGSHKLIVNHDPYEGWDLAKRIALYSPKAPQLKKFVTKPFKKPPLAIHFKDSDWLPLAKP